MNKEICKKQIMPNGSWRFRQCSRKAVKDGFCKQHHPETVKARQKAQDEAWRKKLENSPISKLKRENDRLLDHIKQLEADNEDLCDDVNAVEFTNKKYRAYIDKLEKQTLSLQAQLDALTPQGIIDKRETK